MAAGAGRDGLEPLPSTGGGTDGKGLLMDFMLCGVIHKRGRSSLCLSFPAGKGQLNCSMQRGTGS